MFVGAYWSQRRESKESAAARIVAFLQALADYSDEFTSWYGKASRRAAARRSPIHVDALSIASMLQPNRRDSDRQPIPDLGYSIEAWNGKNASFSATLGCWNERVGNASVLNLGAGERLSQMDSRTMIEEIVRAFDPDHAVVTSHEHLRDVGATNPWDAGVLRYHRGGPIE